ncbi:MAG: hypothetical protein FWD87_08695 [Spirochaetaceae bacterium]|nr:hypothetical protein [Spirochaetaceae bacterium]
MATKVFQKQIAARRFFRKIFVVLFCLTSSFGTAEERGFFDDLFYDPPEDIIVPDTGIEHRRQFEERDGIILRKSFNSTAAASAGWTGFPQLNNLSEGFDVIPGAVAEARLSFIARPSPIFSMGGSVFTEVDHHSVVPDWTDIAIDELYADYIWNDKAFFRMGKFPMAWGNGRIFGPGNLMIQSEKGLTFRATLPTVMDGVTIAALANDHYSAAPGTPFLIKRDTVGAVLLEKVFGSVHFALGGRSHRDLTNTTAALAAFKTVVLRTDVFTDLVLHHDNEEGFYFRTVAGFFREWEKLQMYGEYYFDGLMEENKGHNLGFAIGYKNIFSGPVDVGVEWRHAFVDNSGRVFPAITFSPWPLIRINFGIPILYGDDATRSLLVDRDEDDKESITYHLPSNRGISFLFSIGLSYSF